MLLRCSALVALTALLLGGVARAAPEPAQEPAQEPPAPASNVALLPLWSVGVAKKALAALEKDLEKEMAALPGLGLLPRADAESHLEAARSLGLGCDQSDVECFVKVGALAGVERVVAGFARPGEGGLHLELRLIDVRGKDELRRAHRVLRKQRRLGRKDAREVVTRLLMPARHLGSLRLDVSPRGARVFVADLLRGTAPLRKPLTLPAGFQKVRVEHEGRVPFEQVVEIPFEDTLKLKVRLKKGSADEAADARGEAMPKRFRVLVLDPKANDEGVPNPRTLGSLVAVELASIDRFDVLSGADVAQLAELGAQRQSLGCDESDCLSDLAGALGANLVVAGDVGKIGDQYLINVNLLDSVETRSLGRAAVRTYQAELIPGKMARAVRRLAAGFLRSKGVQIEVPPEEAEEKPPAPPAEVSAAPPPATVVIEEQPRERPFPVAALTVAGAGGLLLAAGVGVAAYSLYPGAYYAEGLERYEGIRAAGDPNGALPGLREQLEQAQLLYYGALIGGLALAGAGATVAATGGFIAALPAE